MLEDQKYVLKQIETIAVAEKVDALLIAGDIYDRSIPAAEAVEVLDKFLTSLLAKKIAVIMISGNHDSPERVSFANKILEKQGLYIAGTYEEEVRRVTLEDEAGKVNFFCLPFFKPAHVDASSSGEAVAKKIAGLEADFNKKERNVLLTHFFVTGSNGEMPQLSDSESSVNVGGLDNVSASIFGGFDYVALGHIHKYQKIGEGHIYYSGSPVKYSFSEAKGNKYINLVTMGVKGEISVEMRELEPLHDMRVIKGKLAELLEPSVVMAADSKDYIQAILTDEVELMDPIGSLRSAYPNVMQIVLERKQGQGEVSSSVQASMKEKSIEELFGEFYEMVKGDKLDEFRLEAVQKAAAEARKEGGRRR